MTADELLKQPLRSEEHCVREPRNVGRDEGGLVVEWHYRDAVATLARRNGRYEVIKWKSSS